jgi:hypothetical protein
VVFVEEPEARSELCREILAALPDWFGIEEAVDVYVRDVAGLPTFAAEAARGFRPLEELTAIWGEANPCLIMVKRLAP